VTVLLLQFMVCALVFFDVPIARQAVGFIYLTFVPGFIIVKLLKLDKLDKLETALFSVGFSIAFLMLAGLLINEFCLLFSVSKPLSLMPLMIILNSLILLGGILVYLRNGNVKLLGAETLALSPIALVLVTLPILSVVGARLVNACENSSILLFLIIAISLLLVVVISKKQLSSKLYPLAALMIAISLLYHSSLISNYALPFGSDVPVEYFVLKTTENSAHWSSTPPSFWNVVYSRINAMLSVTILPSIYSSLLNMDATWIFKILFPLIFSLVPLAFYQVWQTYVGRKYAFISTFLLMAQSTFYTEMVGLNRQMVAELFFVLLLLVVLNKKMKPFYKMICFMVFSFALVTSHYALAEIFLVFISFALIPLVVLRRPSRNITVSMVVFFFVVMFAWYIYTSSASVFDSFLEYGDYVSRQLGEFSDPASRGETVLTGLGMTESPSIWNTASRAFAYITQVFIVVGFAGLVTKRTRIHLEKEYITLSLTAMLFLAALILVPGLANTLNMTRFYHILLFFLAPFYVIGGQVLVKLLFRREKELEVSILLLIVLVPYFLFQTGFVYEVTGSDSYSAPLSKHRMSALRLYGLVGLVDEYSEFGAKWVSKNVNVEQTPVYADSISRGSILTMYGMTYSGYVSTLSNTTLVETKGIVYLSAFNVVHGTMVYGGLLWNTSELSSPFSNLNIVYTNGGSEVYKNPS